MDDFKSYLTQGKTTQKPNFKLKAICLLFDNWFITQPEGHRSVMN